MSLVPIQVILIVFVLFALSRVILRLKDGTVNFQSFLFWNILWILALIGAFRPGITTKLAQLLGIGRGSDVVIYISILLLFYLIFRTNVMLENLRHDLTRLVRDIALKDKNGSSKK